MRELVLLNSQKRILNGKHTALWECIFSVSEEEKVLFTVSTGSIAQQVYCFLKRGHPFKEYCVLHSCFEISKMSP